MGFILGLLLGFLGAIGLAGLLLWWAVTRGNKEAAAKFLQGAALVLNGGPKPPVRVQSAVELKDPMGFQPKSKSKAANS